MYYTRIYPDAAPERGKVPPLRQGVSEKSKVSSISTNAAGFCVKKPWAIPHNAKCRYGERGAAAAKPKGQRSQSARGFCPRSTMRVSQPDIIEHFGNADAVPQPPKRCLSRKAGIVRCCPWNPERIPAALCLTSCLCLRNVRHFPCFQIRLENQRTMNKEGIL